MSIRALLRQGDQKQRNPEIRGKHEQVLSDKPSLDPDVSWPLTFAHRLVHAPWERSRSMSAARLLLTGWSIDLEPGIDARPRAHPAADGQRAWRLPIQALKSKATALSLALPRSMGEQLSWTRCRQEYGPIGLLQDP
jgi:hypothetical protein